jgi:phospholipid/cholesterol/gamma-HCH transport system substrate-binding protein
MKTGLIVSTALIIIFLAVFFSGSVEQLFSPKAEIRIRTKNVSGLRKGAQVWLFGLEIGTVQSIKIHPEGTVVTLSVDESVLKFINKDAHATIMTMGLLGDKYVDITPGSPEAGLMGRNQELTGDSEIGYKDIMATATNSIEKVNEFVMKLEMLVEKVEAAEGTIAQLIKNPALYENTNKAVETISSLVTEIKEAQGSLRLLINDPSLYNEMLSASRSIDGFGKTLDKSSGTIKKLIMDPGLYNNLDEALHQFSVILKRIDKGDGVAGALLKDQMLVSEFQKTLVSIRELTDDIKKNPKKYFEVKIF